MFGLPPPREVSVAAAAAERSRSRSRSRSHSRRASSTAGAQGGAFWSSGKPDPAVLTMMDGEDEAAEMAASFFEVLAVCHNVVAETDPDTSKVTYQAESPDEGALVAAARDVGYHFVGRTPDAVFVRRPHKLAGIDIARAPDATTAADAKSDAGEEHRTRHGSVIAPDASEYKLLGVHEFTSTRKRMSVVVQAPDGRVLLLAKGADNVIFDRCVDADLDGPAYEHLQRHLVSFARDGLRTLVVAHRVMEPSLVATWQAAYDTARVAIEGRDDKLAAVAASVERELRVLGATAIEDKLQDGVPGTIEDLARAGIKTWVLTGDKLETAINVAYSCRLLNDDMHLIQMSANDGKAVRAQVTRLAHAFAPLVHNPRAFLRRMYDSMHLPELPAAVTSFARGGGGGGVMAGAGEPAPPPTHASARYGGPKPARTDAGTTDGSVANAGSKDKDAASKAKAKGKGKDNKGNRSSTNVRVPIDEVGAVSVAEARQGTPRGEDGEDPLTDASTGSRGGRHGHSATAHMPAPSRGHADAHARERARGPPTDRSEVSVSSVDDAEDAWRAQQNAAHLSTDSAPKRGMLDEQDEIETDSLAIIVTGAALEHILGDEDMEAAFMIVAHLCKSVVACRVSPQQKAELVNMVRQRTPHRHGRFKPMTLAIGDGANDVGMIQRAQVGVGISGKEGMQAVNASDFAIAQFRFLKRLLLVHGRWSYRRMSKVVLYSFYKNIVITLTLFYYGFFTGYSGSSLYESVVYSGFNFFLGWPIFVIGFMDRDLREESVLEHPQCYISGRKNLNLGVRKMLQWLLHAIVHSLIVFWLPTMLYSGASVWTADGESDGTYLFGTTCYSCMIFALNWKVCMETYTWTRVNWFFLWVSVLGYFGFLIGYSMLPSYAPAFYGIAQHMLIMPRFWLLMVLVVGSCILTDLTVEWIRLTRMPTPVDVAMLIDRLGGDWNLFRYSAPGGGDGAGDGLSRDGSGSAELAYRETVHSVSPKGRRGGGGGGDARSYGSIGRHSGGGGRGAGGKADDGQGLAAPLLSNEHRPGGGGSLRDRDGVPLARSHSSRVRGRDADPRLMVAEHSLYSAAGMVPPSTVPSEASLLTRGTSDPSLRGARPSDATSGGPSYANVVPFAGSDDEGGRSRSAIPGAAGGAYVRHSSRAGVLAASSGLLHHETRRGTLRVTRAAFDRLVASYSDAARDELGWTPASHADSRAMRGSAGRSGATAGSESGAAAAAGGAGADTGAGAGLDTTSPRAGEGAAGAAGGGGDGSAAREGESSSAAATRRRQARRRSAFDFTEPALQYGPGAGRRAEGASVELDHRDVPARLGSIASLRTTSGGSSDAVGAEGLSVGTPSPSGAAGGITSGSGNHGGGGHGGPHAASGRSTQGAAGTRR